MLHRGSKLHKGEVQSTKLHHRSRTQLRAADGDIPESTKVGLSCSPLFSLYIMRCFQDRSALGRGLAALKDITARALLHQGEACILY